MQNGARYRTATIAMQAGTLVTLVFASIVIGIRTGELTAAVSHNAEQIDRIERRVEKITDTSANLVIAVASLSSVNEENRSSVRRELDQIRDRLSNLEDEE